jgi:RimJ/RimL family protein N-acetyltransferase
MKPVVLSTARLWLDQPTSDDRDLIVEFCRDPLFESFMTLPWPYEPRHADFFIDDLVPTGWATGSEFTWALREHEGGPLLGTIGARMARNDIGYWLGAPHRGKRYMVEALDCVVSWLFDQGWESISWECVVGNRASVAVARANGFRFTGERPTDLVFRDGSHPPAWHGELARDDPREPQEGWPA